MFLQLNGFRHTCVCLQILLREYFFFIYMFKLYIYFFISLSLSQVISSECLNSAFTMTCGDNNQKSKGKKPKHGQSCSVCSRDLLRNRDCNNCSVD